MVEGSRDYPYPYPYPTPRGVPLGIDGLRDSGIEGLRRIIAIRIRLRLQGLGGPLRVEGWRGYTRIRIRLQGLGRPLWVEGLRN